MSLTQDYQLQLNNLLMGSGTSYLIAAADGLRGVAPTRAADTQVIGRSGVIVGLDLLDARTIELEVLIIGTSASDLETKVTALVTAAKPGVTHQLTYRAGGNVQRSTSVRVRQVSSPFEVSDQAGRMARVSLQLLAPDPRWFAAEQSLTTAVTASLGGRTYPLTYPRVYTAGAPLSVVNSGNADADWTATLTGPLNSASILLVETGQMLTYNGAIPSGSSVVLSPQSRTVTLNGVSAFQNLDVTSEWFQLAPGTSTMRLLGSGTGTLTISWRSAWL